LPPSGTRSVEVRVHREIHDQLLDLPRIRLHGPELAVQRRHEIDVLADHAAQQAVDVGDERVQVDHAELQDLAAAEGKKLLRETSRLFGSAHDLLDVAA
jgi:hypothetical protein